MRRCIVGGLLFGALTFFCMLFADFLCFEPWPLYPQSHTPYNILTAPNRMLFEPSNFDRELGPFITLYTPPLGVVYGVEILRPRVDITALDGEQKQKFFNRERLLFCQMYCLLWLKHRAFQLLFYPVIASIAGGFFVRNLGNLSRKPPFEIKFRNFFSSGTGPCIGPAADSSPAPSSVSREIPAIATTARCEGTIRCESNSAEITIPIRMTD